MYLKIQLYLVNMMLQTQFVLFIFNMQLRLRSLRLFIYFKYDFKQLLPKWKKCTSSSQDKIKLNNTLWSCHAKEKLHTRIKSAKLLIYLWATWSVSTRNCKHNTFFICEQICKIHFVGRGSIKKFNARKLIPDLLNRNTE